MVDNSCFLHFRINSADANANASPKAAQIKSFSNETHNLVLTVEQATRRRRSGKARFRLGSELVPIDQGPII